MTPAQLDALLRATTPRKQAPAAPEDSLLALRMFESIPLVG